MLINKHMRQIVDACHPENIEEAKRLWHDIKPVKFGNRALWSFGAISLANYQIPEDAGYLLILKTKCYVFTPIDTDPSFRQKEPPPEGTAQWIVNATSAPEAIAPLVPIHLLAEVSEMLFVKAGNLITLRGILPVPPNANNRYIRTVVYAYHISALIADQIGSGEALTVGIEI